MLSKYYIVSLSLYLAFYQYSVNVSLCSELKDFDRLLVVRNLFLLIAQQHLTYILLP